MLAVTSRPPVAVLMHRGRWVAPPRKQFMDSFDCCSKRCMATLATGQKSSAEVARTITSLVTYGTLCTTCEDGTPLGTFITFVLDDQGCPLLRLRADAVHTENLKSSPQCTLFAHAAEEPARQVARVTLLGKIEELEDEEERTASARHAAIYRDAVGVDAPHPDDKFVRLKVQNCFFVGGLGDGEAEKIPASDYCSAEPDELKDAASRLVNMYNTERGDDVTHVTASVLGVSSDEILHSEFLWIDAQGIDVKGEALGGISKTGRYAFPRVALDELDALSMITMASQVAWEKERSYTPQLPDTMVQQVEQ